MIRQALPLILLFAAPLAQAEPPTLDRALAAAHAAIDACAGKEQQVAVTILGTDGTVKVVLAADGASPRGVASSGNKALTALTFQAPTSQLGEQAKTDSVLAEKIAANTNYNVRAGGLPLPVGAVGVGGAHGSEKDEECAKVAAELLARP
jgi:uncharacterized protein GlcG (DUF336 family)